MKWSDILEVTMCELVPGVQSQRVSNTANQYRSLEEHVRGCLFMPVIRKQ